MVGKLSYKASNDATVEAQVFDPKLAKAFCEGQAGVFDPSVTDTVDPVLWSASAAGALTIDDHCPQCATFLPAGVPDGN